MARGKLRIYLGAVAGVGKTYAMLHEGWLRAQRGTDVVIGLLETHGREETAEQARDLEVVPRRRVEHRGTTLEEMDLDAVLARAPAVALVDELAHTNAPGGRHARRWEDVDELLDAGIDVIATLNIQHLESLNDVVEHITGVRQRETIPDEWVRRADEIQLVELTPEALRRRLVHGDIYPADRVDAALGNFFRPGNLGALRELALMWVADRVDAALHEYMQAQGITDAWETRERVLVALTGAPGSDHVVRRASRIASRVKGELLGVHVRTQDGLRQPDAEALRDQRELLLELGGRFREVSGDDVPRALMDVARAEQVTQVVLGATRRSRWAELTRGSVIGDILRQASDIDVHVIGAEGPAHRGLPRRPRLLAVSARRRASGIVFGLAATALATVLFDASALGDELASVLLTFLAITVVAGSIGGAWAAGITGVVSLLVGDVAFTHPVGSITVSNAAVTVALVVYAVVGTVVALLVDTAARRTADARRAAGEAAAVARLATTVADSDTPAVTLVDDLATRFDLDGVTLFERNGDHRWRPLAMAGTRPPSTPDDASDQLRVDDTRMVALRGATTPAGEGRVMAAYAAQLALALDRQRLQVTAADARAEAEANRLRASLLSAVSHDLRTPLSSIKASASSLLSEDVAWSPDDVRAFAQTIVDESDRLDTLVGNLLSMSQLQTESLLVRRTPTALDEVVPAALHGLPGVERTVLDVPANLPAAAADPVLVERIVANLVDNALQWSPPDGPVIIRARVVGPQVVLEVADRGPGIPLEDRERVFQPFQRLGDGGGPKGVGLGLAVARGFARAVGGDLVVDDTPGGGTTMRLELEVSP